MKPRVENLRRNQLRWLDAIRSYHGWTTTDIAREADVNPSTLTRFVADPENSRQLSQRIVRRISSTTPITPYRAEPPRLPAGFDREEATQIQLDDIEQGFADALSTFTNRRDGFQLWIIHSRALELAGYIPGDVLVVNQTLRETDGDVVLLSMHDTQGQKRFVFRLFDSPYLFAATVNREKYKPKLKEDGNAIEGVVVASLRGRQNGKIFL